MAERDPEIRSVDAGTVLFHEGDEGGEMFVIQSGKIRVTRRVGDHEAVLAVLPAGEFLGEMAILGGRPRTATATAVEDSRLLVVDGRTFNEMIHDQPEVAARMLKKLADRLERSDQMIELLLYRELNHRVLLLLREEAQRRGKDDPAGVSVPISAKKLAERASLPVKTVEQVIERLHEARLVYYGFDGSYVISRAGEMQDFLELLELNERFGDAAASAFTPTKQLRRIDPK